MRTTATALTLALFATACWAQSCKLSMLEKLASSHPECLFFTGTAAFREGRFSDAQTSWQQLLDAGELPIELEHLRTDATNNLGYLFFSGLGTPREPDRALQLWKTAFAKGHEEAAYHLCHVYADSALPAYRPDLGRGYCTEAARRYGALRDEDRENAEVVRQIKRYLSALPPT